jgi:carbamoyltransferase
MEFGPRALGNRSIVGDPRNPSMQSIMNVKIKGRESFRPFAPSCTEESAGDYFDLDRPSPYMLLVAPVREHRRSRTAPATSDWLERVNQVRSDVPAVTHVDYSARIQTVSRSSNPKFHALIEGVKKRTGVPIVINTSFNVRGEPIVCTPEDAYRCFMSTDMDCLAIGPFWLRKTAQPNWQRRERWQQSFAPD